MECVCWCTSGHGEAVTTLLYITSVVTARFSGVTVKTVINNPTIMCHRWDTCTHIWMHLFFPPYFTHDLVPAFSFCFTYPPRRCFFFPRPSSFSHTTRYFPSHDHPALRPHYQLIDRLHCFSSLSSSACSVAAVSADDSGHRYHHFSFRNRNDVQVLLSPLTSKTHKITTAERERM